MKHRILLLVAGLLLVTVPMGCSGGEKPQPLSPAAFNAQPAPRGATPTDSLSRTDQPGNLVVNPNASVAGNRPRSFDQRVEGFSPVVQDAVTAPHAGNELAGTTTAPTSRTTTGPSSGQYLEVGGVVMDVNGTPIYANKVLQLLDPVFAAAASQYDRETFRRFAAMKIKKQVEELRDEQLEYAAAERKLDQKDKDYADMLTMEWRRTQINDAGGSLSVARRRAAEHNENFDDQVAQEYRVWMSKIYYQKYVMPTIQVSASDIRAYYHANRDREFTELGSARFRLIKIDVAKRKTRDEALGLITQLRNRIVKAGEPFESIARSINDDPRLLKSGGDLGTAIQEHAFAIPAVEKAVWETPVGEVTPVVDADKAFYIALVEEKKPSKVHQFEEEAVQSKIDYQLRAEQFRNARDKVRRDLLENAVVRTNEQMVNIPLEMAMQNYGRWAGK
jgi:parvulin-like peptidyl-prolyl isomerase